jgi:hypothetical protein
MKGTELVKNTEEVVTANWKDTSGKNINFLELQMFNLACSLRRERKNNYLNSTMIK